MGIVSGFVVFFIVWWTVLFAVLPWGIRPIEKEEAEDGHQVGAPTNPLLLRKAIQTTIVATIIWLIIFGLVEMQVFSFREWAGQIDLS